MPEDITPDFSDADRILLNMLQTDIPLSADPWAEIGARLGLTGDEVLAKLTAWQDNGLIRKIGASVNPRAMGWFSTLCAANIPENKITDFKALIDGITAITHCYTRKNEQFNLWFTIIAENEAAALEIIRHLQLQFNLAVNSLPATKVYKILPIFQL